MKNNFIIILSITFLCIAINTNGQKLPNKQETSVWAPADIKINGKASEWDTQFKAYNKATEVFYTLANDDQNLYLIIRAEIPGVINKIIRGGLSFIISPAGKSKSNSKDNICLTYPHITDLQELHLYMNNLGEYQQDTTRYKKAIDSFVFVNNKELTIRAKTIKISGIKSISDSLISIYNEYGILTTAFFDHTTALFYKLSLPLRYLKKLLATNDMFRYHILLNAIDEKNVVQTTWKPNGEFFIHIEPGYKNLLAPTDFWGDYILAQTNNR